jgi:hypothetical protein
MEIFELILAFTGMLIVGVLLAFYVYYEFFSQDFAVLDEIEKVKPALAKAERTAKI